jgi:hypothetical protein
VEQVSAAGVNLFVSTNGGASSSCDAVLSPCLTIEQAVDVACAEDTVSVGPGAEADDQLASPNGLGCDTARGSILALPMPAGILENLVVESYHWTCDS